MSIPSSSVLGATMTALPLSANASSALRRSTAAIELWDAYASTPRFRSENVSSSTRERLSQKTSRFSDV